jgi:hypothetical protein
MALSNTQRWLLGSTALFTLPAAATVWWMISSAEPGGAETSRVQSEQTDDTLGKGTVAAREGVQPALASHVPDGDDIARVAEFRAQAEELRAQGLPEKIARETVASRITAAYEARRKALRSQTRAGRADAAIQTQLDALAREQGALIERLFGPEEAPPAAGKGQTSADLHSGFEAKPPQMPAAMADTLPATVQTEEQAAAWEKVRADFVNAIGGEDQDPASPAYRRRWFPAQSEADQRFRLLFGDNAFVQHQLQAAHQAAAQAQAAVEK